jgi:hypothetical protein
MRSQIFATCQVLAATLEDWVQAARLTACIIATGTKILLLFTIATLIHHGIISSIPQ